MLPNKVGIVGHGEIGKSIEQLYGLHQIKCQICDINRRDDMIDCDVLHICIPYNNKFVDVVSKYINEFNPRCVIINSTVQVGTTRTIQNNTGKQIVHSPIRGLHPNLLAGILTFKLFVGSDNSETAKYVEQLYTKLGVPSVAICDNTETTELAKLLDTTYYGICIAFHKEVKLLCDKYNLDFNKVMTEYNETYNIGYTVLGKPNVVRPVLKDVPGPIGGHCVVPNAEILTEIWDSKILELILKYQG